MPLLLGWMARWPLWLLHDVGAALGWGAWLASPSYRRRLHQNAALAGVSAADRRRAVAEAGRMVTELPRLWLRPHDRPMPDPVIWGDASPIELALAQRSGLVLLAPHMGSFEVAAQAYAERFGTQQPMTALYRPARKAWLRELEETARDRPGLTMAPASLAGVRQMLRALRRGETVGLLPDQVPPEGMGVWAPFFGQPAYTMTLASRLVRQTGAALVLMWVERLGRGRGWHVHVLSMPQPLAPASGQAEADDLADAARINQAMEALIRERPSQYLWGYHRYKTPRVATGVGT
jgi:Kdo2-lipid IVA lauroyltransferase/acyltransferase